MAGRFSITAVFGGTDNLSKVIGKIETRAGRMLRVVEGAAGRASARLQSTAGKTDRVVGSMFGAAKTAAFIAPAEVPEIASTSKRSLSSSRSSAPQVKAPCEPPPCRARSMGQDLRGSGLGIVLKSKLHRAGAILHCSNAPAIFLRVKRVSVDPICPDLLGCCFRWRWRFRFIRRRNPV